MRITFDEVTATDLMEFNELMLSMIKSEEKAKKKLKKAEEEPKVRKKPGPKPKPKALDRGKVMACYKAGRSVEWIADEMRAEQSTIEEVIREELEAENV